MLEKILKKIIGTQGKIEDAHLRIIELSSNKKTLLEIGNDMTHQWMVVPKEQQAKIIDEEIRVEEEKIKLLSGRLDPNRRKWLWSITVPILVSVITTVLTTLLISYIITK